MQISMMTYTMARGEWGKSPDVQSLCRLCRELGIEGIDWVTTYGISAKEVRQITDGFGLKNICYTFFGQGLQSADASVRAKALVLMEGELDTAATLGADRIMVVMPGIPDVPREETRAWSHESLNKLVEMGRKRGIAITTEHFPSRWSPFITSSDMKLAVREVPGLAITYDNGNVLTGGENPADGYVNSHKHVIHAHFKDWTIVESGTPALDGRCYKGALIGEGIVDPKPCLLAMHQHGYNGYINLEYEGSDYTPEEAMRKATPLLQSMIAGL